MSFVEYEKPSVRKRAKNVMFVPNTVARRTRVTSFMSESRSVTRISVPFVTTPNSFVTPGR